MLQKVAELHKYRVSGSAAMPNPEKVTAKQKLQQKMAEAALARSKASGTAGGDAPASGARERPGVVGGAGGVGGSVSRLGGNVFGFVGGSSTGTAQGGGSGGTGGGGAGGGGGKKKVVKKPPPNFGGGVLGGK